MKEKYYKNVNTNEIWTEEEYLDLINRETKNQWEEMDDEEKAEEWNNDFNEFYEYWTRDDSDFKLVDENGNDYWRDEYYWNDED